MHKTVLAALARSVFAGLGPDLLQQLSKMGNLRTLDQGQSFQRRGDPVAGVSVVVSGALWVSSSNHEGKRHLLFSAEAGQILNLLPVLDGGCAIHDFDASEHALILLLPKAAFLALLQADPSVRQAMDRVVYARARALYDELSDAMLIPLRQRCARTLVYMMESTCDSEQAAKNTGIRASQADLAEALGYSRPIVNRELSKLKQENVIEIGYQRIFIQQPARLREIAGEPFK